MASFCICCFCPFALSVAALLLLGFERVERQAGKTAHRLLHDDWLPFFEAFRSLRRAAVCARDFDSSACVAAEVVSEYAETYGWNTPGIALTAASLSGRPVPVHFSHASYRAIAYDAQARRSDDMLLLSNTSLLPSGVLPIGVDRTLLNLGTGDREWAQRRDLLAASLGNVLTSGEAARRPPLIVPQGVSSRDGSNRASVMRIVVVNVFKWLFDVDVQDDVGGLLEHDKILAGIARGSRQADVRVGARLARIRAPVVDKVKASPAGKAFAAAAQERNMDAEARLREIVWLVLFVGQAATTDLIVATMRHVLRDRSVLGPLLRKDPDAFLLEAARLSPPIGGMNPFVFGAQVGSILGTGRRLEVMPGDLGFLSAAGANRDPAIFSEPGSFKPDRADVDRLLSWNAELRDIRACGPRGAVTGCAEAPRPCPGTYLALELAREATLYFLSGIEKQPSSFQANATKRARAAYKPMEKAKAAASALAEVAMRRAHGAAHLTTEVMEQARAAADRAAHKVLQGHASSSAAYPADASSNGSRRENVLGIGGSAASGVSASVGAYRLREGTGLALAADEAAAAAAAAIRGVQIGAAILLNRSKAAGADQAYATAQEPEFVIRDRASAVNLLDRAQEAAGKVAHLISDSFNEFVGKATDDHEDLDRHVDFVVGHAELAAEAAAMHFFDGLNASELECHAGGTSFATDVMETARVAAAEATRGAMIDVQPRRSERVKEAALTSAAIAAEAAVHHVLHNSITVDSSIWDAVRKLSNSVVPAKLTAFEHAVEHAAKRVKDSLFSGLLSAEHAAMDALHALRDGSVAEKMREKARVAMHAAEEAIHELHNGSAGSKLREKAIAAASMADASLHKALDGLVQAEHAVEGAARSMASRSGDISAALAEKAKAAAEVAVHKVLEAEHAMEGAVSNMRNTSAAELAQRAKVAADAAIRSVIESVTHAEHVAVEAMQALRNSTAAAKLREKARVAMIAAEDAIHELQNGSAATRLREKARVAASMADASLHKALDGLVQAEHAMEGAARSMASRSEVISVTLAEKAKAAAEIAVHKVLEAEHAMEGAVSNMRNTSAAELANRAKVAADAAIRSVIESVTHAEHVAVEAMQALQNSTAAAKLREKARVAMIAAEDAIHELQNGSATTKLREKARVAASMADASLHKAFDGLVHAEHAMEGAARSMASRSEVISVALAEKAKSAAEVAVHKLLEAEHAMEGAVSNMRNTSAAELAHRAKVAADAAVRRVIESVTHAEHVAVEAMQALQNSTAAAKLREKARVAMIVAEDAIHELQSSTAVTKLREKARVAATMADASLHKALDELVQVEHGIEGVAKQMTSRSEDISVALADKAKAVAEAAVHKVLEAEHALEGAVSNMRNTSAAELAHRAKVAADAAVRSVIEGVVHAEHIAVEAMQALRNSTAAAKLREKAKVAMTAAEDAIHELQNGSAAATIWEKARVAASMADASLHKALDGLVQAEHAMEGAARSVASRSGDISVSLAEKAKLAAEIAVHKVLEAEHAMEGGVSSIRRTSGAELAQRAKAAADAAMRSVIDGVAHAEHVVVDAVQALGNSTAAARLRDNAILTRLVAESAIRELQSSRAAIKLKEKAKVAATMAEASVQKVLDGFVREEHAIEGVNGSTALRDGNISLALAEKAMVAAEVAVHKVLGVEPSTTCAASKTDDICAAELTRKTRTAADAAVHSVIVEELNGDSAPKRFASTIFSGLLSAEHLAIDALHALRDGSAAAAAKVREKARVAVHAAEDVIHEFQTSSTAIKIRETAKAAAVVADASLHTALDALVQAEHAVEGSARSMASHSGNISVALVEKARAAAEVAVHKILEAEHAMERAATNMRYANATELAHRANAAADAAVRSVIDGAIHAEHIAVEAMQAIGNSIAATKLREKARVAMHAAEDAIHDFQESSTATRIRDRASVAASMADASLHKALDGLVQAEHAVEGTARSMVSRSGSMSVALAEKAKAAAEVAVHKVLEAEHAMEGAVSNMRNTSAAELARRAKVAADAAIHGVIEGVIYAEHVAVEAMQALGNSTTAAKLREKAKAAMTAAEHAINELQNGNVAATLQEKARVAATMADASLHRALDGLVQAEHAADGAARSMASRSGDISVDLAEKAKLAAEIAVHKVLEAEQVIEEAVSNMRRTSGAELAQRAKAAADAAISSVIGGVTHVEHVAVEAMYALRNGTAAAKLRENARTALRVAESAIRELQISRAPNKLREKVKVAATMADASVHKILEGLVQEEHTVEAGINGSTALRDSNISVALADKAKAAAEVAVRKVLDAELSTECSATTIRDTCAVELAHKTTASTETAVHSVIAELAHRAKVAADAAVRSVIEGVAHAEHVAVEAMQALGNSTAAAKLREKARVAMIAAEDAIHELQNGNAATQLREKAKVAATMADASLHKALDGLVQAELAVEGAARSMASRSGDISVALAEKAKAAAEVAVHGVLEAEHAMEGALSNMRNTSAAELSHKAKVAADAAIRSVIEGATHAEHVAVEAMQALGNSTAAATLREKARVAMIAAEDAFHDLQSGNAAATLRDKAKIAASMADASLHKALDGLVQAEHALEGTARSVALRSSDVSVVLAEKAKLAAEVAVNMVLEAGHAMEGTVSNIHRTSRTELAHRAKAAADAAIHSVIEGATYAEHVAVEAMQAFGNSTAAAKLREKANVVALVADASMHKALENLIEAEHVAEGLARTTAVRSRDISISLAKQAKSAAEEAVHKVIEAEHALEGSLHEFPRAAAIVVKAKSVADAAVRIVLEEAPKVEHALESVAHHMYDSIAAANFSVKMGSGWAKLQEKVQEGGAVADMAMHDVFERFIAAEHVVSGWTRAIKDSLLAAELMAKAREAAQVATHNFADVVAAAEASLGETVYSLRDASARARLVERVQIAAEAAVQDVMETISQAKGAIEEIKPEKVADLAKTAAQSAVQRVLQSPMDVQDLLMGARSAKASAQEPQQKVIGKKQAAVFRQQAAIAVGSGMHSAFNKLKQFDILGEGKENELVGKAKAAAQVATREFLTAATSVGMTIDENVYYLREEAIAGIISNQTEAAAAAAALEAVQGDPDNFGKVRVAQVFDQTWAAVNSALLNVLQNAITANDILADVAYHVHDRGLAVRVVQKAKTVAGEAAHAAFAELPESAAGVDGWANKARMVAQLAVRRFVDEVSFFAELDLGSSARDLHDRVAAMGIEKKAMAVSAEAASRYHASAKLGGHVASLAAASAAEAVVRTAVEQVLRSAGVIQVVEASVADTVSSRETSAAEAAAAAANAFQHHDDHVEPPVNASQMLWSEVPQSEEAAGPIVVNHIPSGTVGCEAAQQEPDVASLLQKVEKAANAAAIDFLDGDVDSDRIGSVTSAATEAAQVAADDLLRSTSEVPLPAPSFAAKAKEAILESIRAALLEAGTPRRGVVGTDAGAQALLAAKAEAAAHTAVEQELPLCVSVATS